MQFDPAHRVRRYADQLMVRSGIMVGLAPPKMPAQPAQRSKHLKPGLGETVWLVSRLGYRSAAPIQMIQISA